MIDGILKVSVFPAGELHESPVGCWLTMINFSVIVDQVKSDRSTRWTRRRRCGSKSIESIGGGEKM